MSLFEDLGYRTDCNVLNAADYGVPQIRSRIFFIGNRLGLANEFPKKTVEKHKTVGEVIAKLPRLESGGSSRIPNHVAMKSFRADAGKDVPCFERAVPVQTFRLT